MNAKERAEDLVNKHLNINLSQVDDLVDGIRIRLAQENALITVNEMIQEFNKNCFDGTIYNDWLDVRCELNTIILGE
jgi:hypothetical protein